MTFVRSSLDNLDNRPDDDDGDKEILLETIEDISHSCQTALSVLNDLLTFDKIESGQMNMELEMTHPWHYFHSASKPFSVQARQNQVDFTIACDDIESDWTNQYVLHVDQHKMSQVLRNLVSNAMKFTPSKGSVAITMKHRIEAHPIHGSIPIVKNPLDGESVRNTASHVFRIEVKDSGAGISKENQKKLFGQYVQFNASKLQKGAGSGLGLWITKSIVEMHGGSIGAFSGGEGMGSTFFIELPMVTIARERTLGSKSKEHSTRRRQTAKNEIDNGPPPKFLSRQPSRQNSQPKDQEEMQNEIEKDPPSEDSPPSPSPNFLSKASVNSKVAPIQQLKHVHTHYFSQNGKTSEMNAYMNGGDICRPMEGGSPGSLKGYNMPSPTGTGYNQSERAGNNSMGSSIGFSMGSTIRHSEAPPLVGNMSKAYSFNMGRKSSPELAHMTNWRPHEGKEENMDDPDPHTRVRSNTDYPHISASHLPTDDPDPQTRLRSNTDYPHSSATRPPDLAFLSGRNRNLRNNDEVKLNPKKMANKIYPHMQGESPPPSLSPRRSILSPPRRSILEMTASFFLRDSGKVTTLTRAPSRILEESENQSQSEMGMPTQERDVLDQEEQDHKGGGGMRKNSSEGHLEYNEHGEEVYYTSKKTSPKRKDSLRARIPPGKKGPLRTLQQPTVSTHSSITDQNNSKTDSPKKHSIESPKPHRNTIGPKPTKPSGLLFLVVDDSAPTRKIVKRVLGYQGHRAEEALDGVDCLRKVEESKDSFDVILMDDNMPHMSGPEAANALRRKGYKGVIVGVSGNTLEEDVKRFLDSGASFVLPKPLDIEALRDKIPNWGGTSP
eukprot:CAMPEP_0119040616 /NCGR_PEP_ID=MMETSP1177-20130426/10622_1 /TAXON_ID=2985 /ORGANISM="Ochromonas sp, Strain CCMP1899" /LENGTH=834 /DNA_ID=CAMNT_0007005877 /DNA_START=938 /DNA_END=3442 /DNA_ORIENTATION=+